MSLTVIDWDNLNLPADHPADTLVAYVKAHHGHLDHHIDPRVSCACGCGELVDPDAAYGTTDGDCASAECVYRLVGEWPGQADRWSER